MPGSAAKVVITERQHEVLRKMSTATTLAQRLVQRATLILLAFAGMANQDIAARVGRERHQIGMWRRRWQRAFHDLVRIECTDDSPAALRHAIEGLLSDEPRPGCPGKFSAEQLTLLFALACEPPEKSGLPLTHWTGAELAAEAIQRGIVESISASQVNRLLREAELQPHRSRYWLNTTEKDPELFQAQVQIVCACYHDAPQLYFYHDTHTVCVDEMTGIQALERIAPTLMMKPGQVHLRSPTSSFPRPVSPDGWDSPWPFGPGSGQPVTRTARRVGNWHRILARVVGSGSPRDHSTDATSCRTLADGLGQGRVPRGLRALER